MTDPVSDLIIVTGMTGAGRSTAAKALEDLGWFVIDNLPPQLLPSVVRLLEREDQDVVRLAVVVDVRSRGFFTELRGALTDLGNQGLKPRILFLEASDDVLVRRQEAARRPHPLQAGARLLDGITRERQIVRDLRGEADVLIDTTALNVHELAAKVEVAFGDAEVAAVRATVVSFGFKYGIPVDADMVLDMRFLPNPHWVPDLRPRTGLDDRVSDYVLSQPEAADYLDRLDGLLDVVYAGFLRERKQFLTLAVGCTGGKHRSVAIAEEIGARMRRHTVEVMVVHRDLGRE
ncbi:MAG: RNase adapter RapZ [Propionibacteriales bacterium]|nr:RNase adapter RapZ [Propionibacteriales bacterium]